MCLAIYLLMLFKKRIDIYTVLKTAMIQWESGVTTISSYLDMPVPKKQSSAWKWLDRPPSSPNIWEEAFHSQSILSERKNVLNEQNVQRIRSATDKIIVKSPSSAHSSNRSKSVTPKSAGIHSRRGSRPCSLYAAKSVGDVSAVTTLSSQSVALPWRDTRSRSLSRLSTASIERASAILSSRATHLPSRDRKILELMVARHGERIQEAELQIQAHEAWAEEKKQMENDKVEEETARQHALARSRHNWQLQRKLKQALLEEEEQNLLQKKEQALIEKAQKWHSLAQKQEELKRKILEQKRQKWYERKRAQELQLQQQKNENEELRSLMAQVLEHSMVKATQKRQLREMKSLLDSQHANEDELSKHLQKKRDSDEKFRQELDKLQKLIEQKEANSKLNYKEILQQRSFHYKQQAKEREEKFQQVHKIQEQLDKELQEWQNQLKEYRSLVCERARIKTQQQIESRQEEIRKERMVRIVHHRRQMQQIENEEKKKLNAVKEKVKFKGMKSELLARKKDQAITQSRAVAWASADLREKINKTLNPDTFDKKVLKVDLEARLMRQIPFVHFAEHIPQVRLD